MKDKDRQLLDLLVKYFERETMVSSRVERKHPYYRAIVAYGKTHKEEIIPWLLDQIDFNFHWCLALEEIVGDDSPCIPERYAGQLDMITAQWRYWGKLRGYISS